MGIDSRTRSLKVQSLFLMGGRLAGFLFTFFVPVLLVRLLDQSAFGAYKQFFLVATFLIATLPFGFQDALFFFIPRDRARAGVYLAQTAALSLAGGSVAGAALWVFRSQLGALLNSPSIALVAPFLAAYVVLQIVGRLIEIAVVIESQAKLAGLVFAVSDAMRAAALLIPAVLFGSLYWVVVGAVVYALLRFLAVVAWALWQYRERFRVDGRAASLREQASYALPFGFGGLIQNMLLRYHAFYVAGAFSPTVFAIYAVGSQQIAPVQIFFRSLFEVTLVRMTEYHRLSNLEGMRTLWHKLIARQAAVVIPIIVGMWFLTPTFIALVFTPAYLAAVPVFRIHLLLIFLTMLNDHSVLRSCGYTRFIVGANAAGLATTLVLVPGFIRLWGLTGAALAFVAGVAAMKMTGLWKVRQLLQTSLGSLLPWGSLGRYLVTSLIAGSLMWLVAVQIVDLLPRFLASGTAFWVLYLVAGWLGNLFTREDKEELAELARHVLRRLGLARQP